MPRSPFSPIGKRMRTMNDSNTNSDSDESESQNEHRYQAYASNSRISNENFFRLASQNQQSEASEPQNRVNLQATRYREPTNIINLRNLIHGKPDWTSSSSSNSSSDSISGSSNSRGHIGNGRADDIDVIMSESSDSSDSLSNYELSSAGSSVSAIDHEFEEASEYDDDLDYYVDSDDHYNDYIPEEYLKHDPTPETQYPKPDWITVRGLQQRKYGFASSNYRVRAPMYWFEKYVKSSLWLIQRLVKSKTLRGHTGSINSLDFSSSGNLLCSASEDLGVCIWDWQSNRLSKRIYTGHVDNIFHSQFCSSDSNIITSSRDETVRLIDVETGLSEQLMSESGVIGRLAFITPQTLVTCGTNASVNFLDLRMRKPTKLFVVINPRTGRGCALHTINSHPLDNHKIVVAGSSPYVFLYDLRRVARNPTESEHKPFRSISYPNSQNSIVTSTAFNPLGDKLLISYNDDDLFLCRTDTCEMIHRYKGHRNKRTIKECAWFGENFVLSGSDDGHIYGWDTESEHIVCFLEGDRGVVNCLCVHPTLPVLASSGFDRHVKVWEPISEDWPQTLKGIKPQICKNTMRLKRAQQRREHFYQVGRGSRTDDDL